MLRWIMPCLVAAFAIGTVADATAEGGGPAATPKRAAVRAARQLPPGLPRAPYNYRTTVAPDRKSVV